MSFWPFCCKKEQVYGVVTSSFLPYQFCGNALSLEDNPQDWKFLGSHGGVRADGTLWTWNTKVAAWQHWMRGGNRSWGSNASLLWQTTPGDVEISGDDKRPIQIGSDSDWKEIHGQDPLLCLKENGELYAVGDNSNGVGGIGLRVYDTSGEDGRLYRAKISSPISAAVPLSTVYDSALSAWPLGQLRCSTKPSISIQTRAATYPNYWENLIVATVGDIVSQSGSGATVVCEWKGKIYSISLTSGGTGYTAIPGIRLRSSTGSNEEESAGASLRVKQMTAVPIDGFAVTAAGAGYASATATETKTGAVANAVLNNAGSVVSWEIINQGQPTARLTEIDQLNVVVSGERNHSLPNHSLAVASPILAPGSVEEIEILDNPECWETPPIVEFYDGGGSGAAAVVNRLEGLVNDKLKVTDGGSGYSQGSVRPTNFSESNRPGIARIFFLASPGEGEQFIERFNGQDSVLVGEAALAPSGVVSVDRVDQACLTAWPWSEATTLYGSEFREESTGTVLPFWFRVEANNQNVEAVLLGVNGETPLYKELLETREDGVSVYKIGLSEKVDGFTHPPFVLLKYSQVSPDDGNAWFSQDSVVVRHKDTPCPGELPEEWTYSAAALMASHPWIGWSTTAYRVKLEEGDTIEISGPAYGGEATITIIDGWPSLNQPHYKVLDSPPTAPLQSSEIPVARSNDLITCEFYAGPFYKPELLVDQDPYEYPQYVVPNVSGLWRAPSSPQETYFYFPSPPCGGDSAFASTNGPKMHGDQHIGVGDIVVRRPGAGYAEEPLATVTNNFFPEPVRIPGTWSSVSVFSGFSMLSGDLNTPYGLYGDNDTAIGVKDGKLYWWGRASANASAYSGFEITAEPTPVGQGLLIENPTGTQQVAGIDGNRVYCSAPQHGTHIARFLGTSPGEDRRHVAEFTHYSEIEYSPFKVLQSLGLGYETDSGEATFLACGTPVFEPTTRTVGPTSFDKVIGSMARGTDGTWYDLSLSVPNPGLGEPGGRTVSVFPGGREIEYLDTVSKLIGFPPFSMEYTATVSDTKILNSYTAIISSGGSGYSESTELKVGAITEFSPDIETTEEVVFVGCADHLLKSSTVNSVDETTREQTFQNGARDDGSFWPHSATIESATPPTVEAIGNGDGATASVFLTNGLSYGDDPLPFPPVVLPDGGIADFVWKYLGFFSPSIFSFRGEDCPPKVNGYADGVYGNITSLRDGFALQSDGSMLSLNTSQFQHCPTTLRPLSWAMDSHGSGYDAPAVAHFQEQPSEEIATFDVEYDGKLVGIGVSDGGSGYRTPPSIEGVDGASCVISGPVNDVVVANGGSGYRWPPDVRFVGKGISAKASASIANGAVSGVVVSDGGAYREAPEIQFVPVVDVERIDITNSGSGFTSTPQVVVSGGGGEGASATCTIKDGKINSVTVTSGGHHYAVPPKVLFVGGGGGYAEAVAVLGSSGGGAAGSCTINGSVIYASVEPSGDNYDYPPPVSCVRQQGDPSGGGADAVLSARVVGKVTDISVASGGDWYLRNGGAPNLFCRRKMSSVSLRGLACKIVPGSFCVGVVGNGTPEEEQSEFPQGGPIQYVEMNDKAKDCLYFHKPIAIAAYDSYAAAAVTCNTISGVVVEKLSEGLIESPSTGVALKTSSAIPWAPHSIAECRLLGQIDSFYGPNPLSFGKRFYDLEAYPNVVIEDETGEGADLFFVDSPHWDYFTNTIEIGMTSPGGNYSQYARIRSYGGNPYVWSNPATAVANMAGDAVESVTVTFPSKGYTSPPTIYFVGGGGAGAVAGTPEFDSDGGIVKIPVTDSGFGYTSPPAIVIIDSEKQSHRDDGADKFFRSISVRVKNWSIEYAKPLQPFQVSTSSMKEIYADDAPIGDQYRFTPAYRNDGYVESVWPMPPNTNKRYAPESHPGIEILATGTHGGTTSAATASLTARKWSEVYGGGYAKPLVPSAENYE